jgi:hypothetical protein
VGDYSDRESSLQGADYSYVASVACNPADPLVKAYLTFKAEKTDADPGALQKTVTVNNSAGVGQIIDDGSTNGIAQIRFDITAAQSAALSPRDYWWDVKVKTAGTALAYGAGGIWHFHLNVTDSI